MEDNHLFEWQTSFIGRVYRRNVDFWNLSSWNGLIAFNVINFPFPGIRQVWLCLCEWKGVEGPGENGGELHLQLHECSAGAQRVDSTTPAADWGVRRRAEPDKKLEGAHSKLKKVGP